MITPQFLVIAGSEQKTPDWRAETCDACIVKRVYLQPRGAFHVDEAEDAGERLTLVCVACAMIQYGQALTIQVLVAQEERWK